MLATFDWGKEKRKEEREEEEREERKKGKGKIIYCVFAFKFVKIIFFL